MKRIIAAAALLLLTACSGGDEPKETAETSAFSDTVPESVYESSVSSVTQTEAAEFTPLDGKIVDKMLSSAKETDLSALAGEEVRLGGVHPCGGDNICVCCYDGEGSGYVQIISLSSGEGVNRIDFPVGSCRPAFYENKSGGNVTAYAEFVSDEEGLSALAEIYPDGNYVLTSGLTAEDMRFSCGERDILQRDGGLILDGETTPIMKMYSENPDPDADINRRRFLYCLTVDSSRFVYRAAGYESMPCFGVYDIAEEKPSDISDSRNKLPIGVCGGLIYSKEAYWDGFGSELYVSDPDTRETRLICQSPFDIGLNEYTDYFMSQGNYIGAHKHGTDTPDSFALIDPPSGEIAASFSFDGGRHFETSFFTDSYICFVSGSKVLSYEQP